MLTVPKWGTVAVALWAVVTFECMLFADDETTLRQDMLRLTASERADRLSAIESLQRVRDDRVLPFLEAYQRGEIYLWNSQLIFCAAMNRNSEATLMAPLSDPLTRDPIERDGQVVVVAKRELDAVGPRRPERRLITNAIRVLELWSSDRERRLGAVRRLGDTRNRIFMEPLEQLLDAETDEKVRHTARESVYLLQLAGTIEGLPQGDRIEAIKQLGEMASARAVPVLKDILAPLEEVTDSKTISEESMREALRQSLAQIESYQQRVRVVGYLFSGLSLGSILILMALGLSVIFGQMGVINMAHGELMMVGAYATYQVQKYFGHSLPDNPENLFYVWALPVAFFSAAGIGWLMELLVVRHLYGRPLETLLATWGIGLILMQAVRLYYGDNIGVNSPEWLMGGMELFQDFRLPYNRLFIIVLTLVCLSLLYALMRYTRTGLWIRATVQNREIASSLGVNTRRTDGLTFALGSGLAGIAGYALTLIGGVTPDMGQNYIVDSFLVVATGGVGELAGAVIAGLSLGVINKFLEPFFGELIGNGAIWGKVAILIVVIFFIQWRPAGLFPPRGRTADL
ncbi:MAG: urea ABC transporter permease subunit UrtB [Planctomycetota bacterium]|nr:urea ABC transporter permease subunit UrtB [Planctomycetota bacterium]